MPDGPTVSISLPAIRVEVRVPPPPNKGSRSGAVILDLHDLRLSPGDSPEQDVTPTARFGTAEDIYDLGPSSPHQSRNDNVLLAASWKRLVVSCALYGDSKARALLSLGPLSARENMLGTQFGAGSPPARGFSDGSLRPQLVISRTSFPEAANSTAVSVDLPSIHVELSKPIIDGLQLWADDLTQLTERAFAEPPTGTQGTESGDTSLIGSRYFARASTAGSGTESGVPSLANTMRPKQEPRSETAVKIAITEGTRIPM